MASATARLSLHDASRASLAAAESGDWDALQRALESRGVAIAAGDIPEPGDFDDGEKVFVLLSALVREVSLELSRLRQVSDGFAYGAAEHPSLVVRG